MKKSLKEKRIALVGPRRSEEMSVLVQNLGGIPLIRPAQGTVFFLDDSRVEEDIHRLIQGGFDWAIFTTGVGLETLYKIATKNGRRSGISWCAAAYQYCRKGL
ncbi:hypothetical protein GCM10020331_076790 [Ectobacillus funiculus]